MERLVLDSSIWISLERGHLEFDNIFHRKNQIYLPAIVLAELKSNAQDSKRGLSQRQRAMTFIHEVEQLAEFVPVNHEVINAYVTLKAFCRESGRKRGLADLLIAATAVVLDAALMSLDKKAAFEELPNLRVIS